MSGLQGARVALLEAPMSEELASLVRRHGGEPCCFLAIPEEAEDCGSEVSALLDEIRHERSIFVFSTGVGVTALFAAARRLGRDGELSEALRRGLAICRGPKPAAALRREGLEHALRVPEPYTTAALVEVLAKLWLPGRHLVLVHYGERHQPLVAALEEHGARVRELVLYRWDAPEDAVSLSNLVAELVEERFRAIAFTSQGQARRLFQVAAALGREEALQEALRARTVVAAAGPTCASALAELGAPPHVVAQHPRASAMVLALAEHLARQES